MKCPHCGREILNGENFSLQAPTRATLVRAKARVLGDGPAVIELPAIGGDVEIRKSVVDEWADVYAAVDVPTTLKEIRQWLLAHPTRRKTNVRAFVNNWLKREQDRG